MKEYKITVKPYLNKRVKPFEKIVYTAAKVEKSKSHLGLPLYYQIIYKRKNTHIRSLIARNKDSSYNYFSTDGGLFDNPGKKEMIIERETEIIKNIIRFKEAQEDNFTLSGFAEIYHSHTDGLHFTINNKLKARLLLSLTFTVDQNIRDFLNFEKGTYYSIYRYTDILFKHLDLYSTKERELFEQIKKFFELYDHKETQQPNHLKHHFNVPENFFGDPIVIDFYNGKLEEELTDMGLKPTYIEELLKVINSILKN